MPQPWQPKIEKRDHPFGEEGTSKSLEEVANRIKKGYLDPRVRAWAIECLERARREEGRKADSERERAEILLAAVQKKLWVPDSVGAEWMAGAHLTLCVDKDAPCFHGGDCDDKSVALGAAMMSVGLWCCVVGHSYNTRRDIEHVLVSVRIDGRWEYADPSATDWPIGRTAAFTRERILSLPEIKVICDSDSCIRGATWDPAEQGFVSKGTFVGVDGIPKFAWLEPPPPPKFEWLGQTTEELTQLVDEEKKIEKAEKKLSLESKILLAGFALSAASFAWQVYTWTHPEPKNA